MTNKKENKELGYVHIVEPVGGHGGMDYYDYGLALGLGEHDVKVKFYTCDVTRTRTYKNVETVITFKGLWKKRLFAKVNEYLTGHFKAFNMAKKAGGKIVHLHFFTFRSVDLMVIALARSMSFKVIATLHDVSSFHKQANRFVERSSYKLIDGIIVHNQSSMDALNQKSFVSSPVRIIPHGNYLPFIESLIYPAKRNVPFRVLFFGQIKTVKGLDVLIKAIKLVKDKSYNVELVIAGKAWKSDLNLYEELINDLKLSNDIETHFRYIKDEEIASFYEGADLVILPYREIYQSGVLLLTMSYGRPVLCSDLSPFKEFVAQGENGFLFRSEDHEDLAKQICYLIDHPEALISAANQSNLMIRQKFDWSNIGQLTKDFYEQIL